MVHLCAWALGALSLASLSTVHANPNHRGHAASSASGTEAPGASCRETATPLPNGDFESGSLAPWTPSALSAVKIVPGGHNSGNAVQLSTDSRAQIRQSQVAACIATNYTVSFDYKVINASAKCVITSSIGNTKYHQSGTEVDNLQPGDWKTASYEYDSDLDASYATVFALNCNPKSGGATVLLDNIKVTAVGSLDPTGCPNTVGLSNGGFDDGQLSPWTLGSNGVTATKDNAPYKFVSPGYNSKYAMELDFPAASSTDFMIVQDFANLCIGYYYNISIAVNWLNYTGPKSDQYRGCKVGLMLQECDSPYDQGQYYATNTSGWQEYAVQCQANSNAKGEIIVNVLCDDNGESLPPFALQLDGFNVEVLPGGPPAPTTSRPTTTPTPTPSALARRGHFYREPVNPRWV